MYRNYFLYCFLFFFTCSFANWFSDCTDNIKHVTRKTTQSFNEILIKNNNALKEYHTKINPQHTIKKFFANGFLMIEFFLMYCVNVCQFGYQKTIIFFKLAKNWAEKNA